MPIFFRPKKDNKLRMIHNMEILNGLTCCPRFSFIKMLKPVMAYLHSSGFISTIFINDILLIGGSELECVGNSKISSHFFFRRLGFVIHSVKSVLRSTHTVKYLGFEINSESMTVSLMQERKERIFTPVVNLLHQDMSTV